MQQTQFLTTETKDKLLVDPELLKGFLVDVTTGNFQTKLKKEIERCMELTQKKSNKMAKKHQV